MTRYISWILLFSSILLGAFGQVFLKLAVEATTMQGFRFYQQLAKCGWLYLGAIAYGSSFILWLAALRNFDISYARPFMSLGYIVTYLLAIPLLGEVFLWRRMLGIVVIIIGVMLLK